MSRLITLKKLEEGELFHKWLYNRLIKRNKNVLGAELGPTGSGKSWRDLRKVELWYKNYLKKPFPKENICFGVADIMKRITSKELTKGEVLIFEEAGANLGSLDFQSKVSKMFTYVLQSFRSMNIAIFFNLPYLSMLNKQARMLLHYSSESVGIDFSTKTNKCKLFFHQVNQGTGKIYKKYPRAKVKGSTRTIKKMNWGIPSKELIDAYEAKKAKYLMNMTTDYLDHLEKLEYEKIKKLGRPDLSEKQKQLIELLEQGYNQIQIAKMLSKSQAAVSDMYKTIRKNGYKPNMGEIPRKIKENHVIMPPIAP